MIDMTHPIGVTPLDTVQDGLVGKPIDRVDGEPKVTGSATYAYEYKEPDGIAYGFLVPATIAKGRIATLDTAVAEKMPGVVAVLTYRNAPKQGKESQQVSPELVDDKIRHYGQAVACVVAETFEQARAAAYAVDVGYAPDAVNLVLADNVDRAIKPKDRGTSSPDTSSGDAAAAFASPATARASASSPRSVARKTGSVVRDHSAPPRIDGGMPRVPAARWAAATSRNASSSALASP